MARGSSYAGNAVTVVTVIVAGAFLGWLIAAFWPILQKLRDGQLDQGTGQSLTALASGFPDGGDPGAVPAVQHMQGIVESLRNLPNYLFGSDEDQAGDGPTNVYLAPSGSDISTVPLPVPTPDQIADAQGGIANYEQWAGSPGNVEGDVTDWFINNVF